MKKFLLAATVVLLCKTLLYSQGVVPRVQRNIMADDKGRLHIKDSTGNYYRVSNKPTFTLDQLKGNPKGDVKGIAFYFGAGLNGTLYYGLISYTDNPHPLPAYFKDGAKIDDGAALINIADNLKGKNDITGWEKTGRGTLGYRVVKDNGQVLYDGIINFSGKGPFKVAATITEGPFVNMVTEKGAIISFETNEAIKASVNVGGVLFTDNNLVKHHEIELKGLKHDSLYTYTVVCGELKQVYSFRTAPLPGSRSYFIFAFGSNTVGSNGGGDRNVYGVNAGMLKNTMALANHKGVAFAQFSGNLINGYLENKEEARLQYANWKRAAEPFGHELPIYTAMGSHEALLENFTQEGKEGKTIAMDKFPYATESAEAIFATSFVNPTNGPVSEDDATYDPDPGTQDFPPYKENVYYYTYDNVGVIVLNSDYWYAPTTEDVGKSGGNVHGYIMDQQLKWLEKTLHLLEDDLRIDHIFVTLNASAVPNGNNVKSDMWYGGSDEPRPAVRASAVSTSIIQRRDQLLDLLVNQSNKVVALLTGEEGNYCTTEITTQTPLYIEGRPLPKQRMGRSVYQINCGAVSTAYGAQQKTPWEQYTSGFTNQNAVVFFHITGRTVEVEVVNPETMEEIESFELRK